jgi:hypothetical protein
MKQAITIRVDPKLLTRARECAQQENRSLTNYIETALKELIGNLPAVGTPHPGANLIMDQPIHPEEKACGQDRYKKG